MTEPRPGRVIIVNGASSSGKSAVCRALQMLFDEPHLFSGLDFFTPMLPPRAHIGMSWQKRTNDNAGDDSSIRWVFPEKEGDPVRIEFGEPGHRLIRGMHAAIAALAGAGNNVIVEHVLLYEEWLVDLLDALDGLEVYFVGVHCPIELLEEREQGRADRVVGQARSHYEAVYSRCMYDAEVDSSSGTPAEAAEEIAAVLAGRNGPTAFERMRATRR